MPQQIFVIHGGSTFDTYEEYFADLQNKEVSLEDLPIKDWKSRLDERLGTDYQVLSPRMPNSQNAKYKEWKIWFSKFPPLLQDNPIFIGHSLGGIFLAKYLAEEAYPKPILATFLVAAPYQDTPEESLADFKLPASLEKFSQQGGQIFLYHSQDDPVVPFDDLELYKNALPKATVRVFTDRQHFNQPELPDIVADIQQLTATG